MNDVIGSDTKTDYTPITHDADAEPSSELRGTWDVRAPYVTEQRRYRRIRGVEVDLMRSGVVPRKGKTVTEAALVAKGNRVITYAPAEVAGELLGGLVDLAQERVTPTDFANRFGYMGYNELVPSEYRCGGEPLNWLLAHARTLFVAFHVIHLVNPARRSELHRKKLAEYIRNELPYGPYAQLGWIFQVPALRGSAGSSVMAANNVLRYLINPNIDTVGRQLIADGTELKSIFVFQAPIQVAYWHLTSLIGKQSLRRCKECHRVFIDERNNVKFCLPAPGKKISRCKARFNIRKMRKHQKELSRKINRETKP